MSGVMLLQKIGATTTRVLRLFQEGEENNYDVKIRPEAGVPFVDKIKQNCNSPVGR